MAEAMTKDEAARIAGEALGEYVASGRVTFTLVTSQYIKPEDHVYKITTDEASDLSKAPSIRSKGGEIEEGRWAEIVPRQLSAILGSLMDNGLVLLNLPPEEGKKKSYPYLVAHLIEPMLTEDGGERAEAAQVLLSRKVGRPRGAARPKAAKVLATIDPVSRLAFGQNSKAKFTPEDYLAGRSKSVRASKNGWINVYMKASEDLAKSGDPNDYMMGGMTWFWHDGIYSLASQGERYFAGSDILRQYGYTNPYSPDSASILLSGFREVMKLTQNVGWVDASKEKRKDIPQGFKPLFKTRPWVEASVVIGHNGNSFDWSIQFKPDEDPLDYLLIAQYATLRQMVAEIDKRLYVFGRGVHPSGVARMAYAYLIRQASIKGIGNKVTLSTLFDSLDLEPPDVASKKGTGKATPRKDGSKELRSFAEIARAEKEADRQRKKRIIKSLQRMLAMKQDEKMLTYSIDKESITVNLKQDD